MYCRVIACDFDGTVASNGRLVPEVAAALSTARARGFATMLVTGRIHEEVENLCADLSMFDAVVAENGAIVCLPAKQRTIRLGKPPPADFLGELRVRGVPFHAGNVVIGTWEPHAHEVLDLIRRSGVDAHLVFNRAALMLLPQGISKATGVRRALQELGRSEHNLIAFGDAENDLPLFAVAEVAVAARGSVPAVADAADERLSREDAPAIAQYIHRVIASDGIMPTPSRQELVLGRCADGTFATLPASGTNVMISGDPRCGKSRLLALLAEQLIERDYRICIIDPEGDYVHMTQMPHVLSLGVDLPLPKPKALGRLFSMPASVVLHLTCLSQAEQSTYVEELLQALWASSAGSGMPNWILIDEAHYFFDATSKCAQHLSNTANFVLATYRPSLLSNETLDRIGAYLIGATTVEHERYFASTLLSSRGPGEVMAAEALNQLDSSRVGLLIEGGKKDNGRWQVFTPSTSFSRGAHHARKYVDSYLTEQAAFRFLQTNGSPRVAHNVLDFCEAVKVVPQASLRHHAAHGDFSSWANGVLGDEALASGLRKLERTARTGAPIDRNEIIQQITDHYFLEEPEHH